MTNHYTPTYQARNVANKRRVSATLHALIDVPTAELADVLRDGYHADAAVNVSHPINELTGLETVLEQVALPDAERRDDIIAGGSYRDADWIGCMGYYLGTFTNDLLGIPANRGVVALRYAEGHQIRDGKIAVSYLFIDFLDLMRQVGYVPIAPSLGREMQWLPPRTHDGVIFTPQDDAVSKATLEKILNMHAALGYFKGGLPDRAALDDMQMVQHWHPNFMWYGPSGIGTTRGLAGFEDYHQIPFLAAFPDRRGDPQIGHFISIGDGYYAVTGGWGSLQATHTGHGFLGMPPTGKRIKMRVMDFYRCNDTTIIENWVPIDVPHILNQMGVDIFGRMRHQFRQHNADSVSTWLVGR
jgi:predicted ester cyclase